MPNSLDPDHIILSGLIWVQTVYKDYQQTATLSSKESNVFGRRGESEETFMSKGSICSCESEQSLPFLLLRGELPGIHYLPIVHTFG